MMMRDMRPMAVGEVLDRSFQVLRRHVGTLFVTAVLGSAPLLLIYLATGSPYAANASGGALPTLSGLVVLYVLIFAVTLTVSWAALTHQVNGAVEGVDVGVAGGLAHGARRFFATFFLGVLIYLLGGALVFPAAVVGAMVSVVGTALFGSGLLGVVIAGTVIAAALFGALVLWTPMAFLSLPALIAEGVGPVRALNRAHELGKRGRLRILGTALVAWILMMLPTIGLPFLFGFGLSLWRPATAGTVPATQFYLYQAVTFIVGGLTTPFMVAVMVHSYYDRRVRREGYDVELASESIPESV